MYAQFHNGMAYGFFHGKPLDESMARDDNIATLIAKEMVRLHSVQPDQQDPAQRRSYYSAKTQNFLNVAPTSFDDPKRQEIFQRDIPSKADLQKELDEILQQLRALNMPVVFSHNDLLLKNIIYDEEKDEVHFIDYEYAFLNYEAYDIGNHFCEYAGIDEVNYDLYPDKPYQMKWLRRYASLRLNEYFRRKKEFFSLALP
nr:hypothetical protein BaRGS_014377 [Batillaria attramentaria]